MGGTSVRWRPQLGASVTTQKLPSSRVESDGRTDGQSFLVDLFGRSGTCVSYWGPLGRKWSRISCNHPPRGRDVMFLIWFLLLPSAASSGVLAGNSCSSFLVCFCAIHSFPSTDGCFWLSLLSLLSGSCYVAITLTVSPCDADPQEQKKLLGLSAIDSVDVA